MAFQPEALDGHRGNTAKATVVTPDFKAKQNAHSMCVQESSFHTYHIKNGYRIANVTNI
jgi:hypothetical protein